MPKLLAAVFFMALALGTYWLFGLSRLRGWTLLAIFAVSLAAFLWGLWLLRDWLHERQQARDDLLPGETFAGRPWLRVPAWRRREIVSGKVVGTPVLLLAYVFIGGPAAFFGWVALSGQATRSGESLLIPGTLLLLASLLALIVGGLTYWRLRHWRYGNSVCRLLTLPGRVGGRFDADVDCALPGGTADEAVVVRLKNWVQAGRSATVVWSMEQRITVPVLAERTVVPVRLRIPRHADQQVLAPDAGALARFAAPWWTLELEKNVPGIDFLARFAVPVYDVPELPEAPLPAAPAKSARDRGGRRAAALIGASGVAAFVAITYQARAIGWLSTGVMKPSAQWLEAGRFQRELDVWSMSHYPPVIEGRCAAGRLEYRSEWLPIPAGTSFRTWYGMTRRQYQLRQGEYAAAGFTLEATSSFRDCAGAESVQATWLKRR